MIQSNTPDLSSLFESWSKDFSAQVNRVYHLIGDVHLEKLGNHREILFRNFLRTYLPNSWSVSTGFIVGDNKIIIPIRRQTLNKIVGRLSKIDKLITTNC